MLTCKGEQWIHHFDLKFLRKFSTFSTSSFSVDQHFLYAWMVLSRVNKNFLREKRLLPIVRILSSWEFFPQVPTEKIRTRIKSGTIDKSCLTEVESLRTSLASRTSWRTHFEVLGLGLEGQVLGLGLEALKSLLIGLSSARGQHYFLNC